MPLRTPDALAEPAYPLGPPTYKHKVSTMEGAWLDAAVAEAGGISWLWFGGYGKHVIILPGRFGGKFSPFSPTKEWAHAGPFLDRGQIECKPVDGPGVFLGEPVAGPRWLARAPGKLYEQSPSLLTAAMRAYVASKFGGEIELSVTNRLREPL